MEGHARQLADGNLPSLDGVQPTPAMSHSGGNLEQSATGGGRFPPRRHSMGAGEKRSSFQGSLAPDDQRAGSSLASRPAFEGGRHISGRVKSLGPLGIEGRFAGPDRYHHGRGSLGRDEQDVPIIKIRTGNALGYRASDFRFAWRCLAEEIRMKTSALDHSPLTAQRV